MSITRASIAACFALVGLFACSSKPDPVANGGVDMQFVNPAASVGDNCPARGTELLLFGKDSSGNKTLLVDGSNSANVSCTVGGSSYKASVSLPGQTFIISGSVTQQGSNYVSNDASVNIIIATGSYSTSSSSPCIVNFSMYSSGAAGSNQMVMGSISCPDLLNDEGAGQDCALNSAFSSNDAFSFQSCN